MKCKALSGFRVDRTVLLGGTTLAAFLLATAVSPAADSRGGSDAVNSGESGNPYSRWKQGPPADPDFFPVSVWLQHPRNASRYRDAGVNVYVGLWRGPTEEQLRALGEAGMRVICHQNEVGLAHRDDATIIGWMHGDEPDNAQSLGPGKGYGPPVAPPKIVEDYERLREADPSRPVLLNLGQGVAWDAWHGRGTRTNHPEDYPRYVQGCDIASFDIYPAVHSKPEVAGKLWFVPRGVDRLRNWTGDRKIVWNCIECTRISNTEVKPTPRQVKAEVWMSLIHGSMGIIYFVHQFRPKFVEAGLLADPEMLEAVTAINRQIHELAPALNSPSVEGRVSVVSSHRGVPIDILVKARGDNLHVFAVAMRPGTVRARFTVGDPEGYETAEDLGTSRVLKIQNGVFEDCFYNYAVHLYRLRRGQN